MSRMQEGTTVDGRYKLEEKLGTGGMADVYAAEDRQLGRRVALKIMHRHFAEDGQVVARFRREASSAASLSHPGIVGVYDRGEWDGVPYMAMEIVEGETLKDVIGRDSPMEPVRAIDYAVEILRALRYAHRRGLVHRDVKPQNVLVTDGGDVKVADFGIARAVDDLQMTQTGMIVGTAHYLSPEQASGQHVTPAADLYSVGVVLFEMLTGRLPFDGDQPVAIALKHANEEPPALSVTTPSVPTDLERIVLRALEKDPERRYADADEFVAVLEATRGRIASGAPEPSDPWAAAGYAGAAVAGAGLGAAAGGMTGHGVGAEHPWAPVTGEHGMLPAAGMAIPTATEQEEAEWQRRRERNRRRAWLAAGAAALVAIVVVAVILLSGGTTRVPSVVGQEQVSAESTLRGEGLDPRTETQASSSVDEGSVISQDPAGGSRVDDGARVTLTVSSGPQTAVVPPVNGRTRADARSALRDAGFTNLQDTRVASESVQEGLVTQTSPPGGTEASTDQEVVLTISSGPADGRVPDVVGNDQDTATEAIATSGFTTNVERRRTGAEPEGTVLEQTPAGGSSAEAGSEVTIVVAQEAQPSEAAVPDVTGRTTASARSALEAAGFAVTITRQGVTSSSQNGRVLSQDPSDGRARRGSTVTITVGRFTSSDAGGSDGDSGGSGTTTTTPEEEPPTTPTTPEASGGAAEGASGDAASPGSAAAQQAAVVGGSRRSALDPAAPGATSGSS